MSRFAGRGFVVGVGSNLSPERNVAAVLQALLQQFDHLLLSRIVYTAPEAVPSPQWFINTVLFVPCALTADELKQRFNRIETELGRNRSDPNRKWRDRPADLDILHFCQDVSDCHGWQVRENYLAPLVNELLAYVQNRALPTDHARTAYIYMMGSVLGQTAATVYRDHATGLVRVV